YVYNLETYHRPDVTDHFMALDSSAKFNYDNSGILFYVSKKELIPENYEIWFLITNNDSTYFQNTGYKINNQLLEPSIISLQSSENAEMKHKIENINKSKSAIEI